MAKKQKNENKIIDIIIVLILFHSFHVHVILTFSRKMKKFKPSVELGFTDRGKRNLILHIGLAISLGVVLPLILRQKE